MDIINRRSKIVGLLLIFLVLNLILSRFMIFARFKQVAGMLYVLQFICLVIRFKKGWRFVSHVVPTLLGLAGLTLLVLSLLSFMRDDRGDGALILGLLSLYVFFLAFMSRKFTKALIQVNMPDFHSPIMTRAQHSMELIYGSTFVLMSICAYSYQPKIITQGIFSVFIMVMLTVLIFVAIYYIFTKVLKKDLDAMMLTMMGYMLFTVLYALTNQLVALIPLMLAASVIATYLFVFHPDIKGDYKLEK